MPENHFYRRLAPQLQADALVDQASPGEGYYTVLEATNVRLLNVRAKVTWTAQPLLGVRITIDGLMYIFSVANPVSNTYYFCEIDSTYSLTTQLLLTTNNEKTRAFLIESRTVKIEVYRTGGTASLLTGIVKYQKL